MQWDLTCMTARSNHFSGCGTHTPVHARARTFCAVAVRIAGAASGCCAASPPWLYIPQCNCQWQQNAKGISRPRRTGTGHAGSNRYRPGAHSWVLATLRPHPRLEGAWQGPTRVTAREQEAITPPTCAMSHRSVRPHGRAPCRTAQRKTRGGRGRPACQATCVSNTQAQGTAAALVPGSVSHGRPRDPARDWPGDVLLMSLTYKVLHGWGKGSRTPFTFKERRHPAPPVRAVIVPVGRRCIASSPQECGRRRTPCRPGSLDACTQG